MMVHDLPLEAITGARTFNGDLALHDMLRSRRSDPMPMARSDATIPFWLVPRHAVITAFEQDTKRFIPAGDRAARL